MIDWICFALRFLCLVLWSLLVRAMFLLTYARLCRTSLLRTSLQVFVVPRYGSISQKWPYIDFCHHVVSLFLNLHHLVLSFLKLSFLRYCYRCAMSSREGLQSSMYVSAIIQLRRVVVNIIASILGVFLAIFDLQ